MRPGNACRGFTLLELVVVLAILVTLASLSAMFVAGAAGDSAGKVTQASLAALRDSVSGTQACPGFAVDNGRTWFASGRPAAGQFRLTDLFVRPGYLGAFEPVTRLGWRGPYAVAGTGRVTYTSPAGPVSFRQGEGAPEVLHGSFPTACVRISGDILPSDGWRRPIFVQIPGDSADPAENGRRARLVSAGPDGIVQTPATGLPARSACGDDLVVYLFVADERP
ncbi:MAG: type II secretion system protein [Candidatus Brocadiae bacterium]|nr:type II secretion system protein [Candidatus Brocadiia bacterium]